MSTRDPETYAERHMMSVWWIYVVSMVTHTNEDLVAFYGNAYQTISEADRLMVSADAGYDAGASWLPWIEASR